MGVWLTVHEGDYGRELTRILDADRDKVPTRLVGDSLRERVVGMEP